MRQPLDENRAIRDADGRAKLHADIAHPINSMCREKIQGSVLASYADELERSKLPGYVSRYDDLDGGEFDVAIGAPVGETAQGGGSEPPLRRSPLRGHSQHSRGGVLRGPHVPARKEEGVGSEHRETSQGFGGGL